MKAVVTPGPQGSGGFSSEDHPQRIRVWDAPIRLFHWTLAAAFAGEWFTRDARFLELHEFLGYAIGLLVAFRILWGFAGTRWARFATFPPSIPAALRYLRSLARRAPPPHVGHNPAGSWAIYALLALAASQVVTGIIALGAEERLGPLAGRLGYAAGDAAHQLHEWLAWAMLGVVAVHVAGVFVGSLLERENLVASMVTGFKRAPAAFAVEPRRGVALALAAVLGMIALVFFREDAAGAGAKSPAEAALAHDATWKSECGGCHLAYHPSLLPARSWAALLAPAQDHFGEDLALDAKTAAHLSSFAASHSADAHESHVAWKISTTTPRDRAPLRISDTPYWKRRHARMEASTWNSVHPSQCDACHRDADAATFSPRAIALTRPANAKIKPEAR